MEKDNRGLNLVGKVSKAFLRLSDVCCSRANGKLISVSKDVCVCVRVLEGYMKDVSPQGLHKKNSFPPTVSQRDRFTNVKG